MGMWDYIPTPAAQIYNGIANGKVFGKTKDEWSDTMFGGNATKGMASGPASAAYQQGYLQNDFMNRSAPQMNAGQSDQTRGQQGQLANMLFQQANGTRAGAGEMAVNRQVGSAMAQQTSAAQMARGAGSALAARNAARSTADIGVNGAGMAAQAQMQDQTNAQGQLGGLLGNMRGQDIGVAQGNQQAQMQQQQLQLQGLAQMLNVDVATLQQDLAKRQIAAGDKGMLPGLLQMGGQIGAAYATGGMSAAGGGGGGGGAAQSYAMPQITPPAPTQGYRSPNDSYILGPGSY